MKLDTPPAVWPGSASGSGGRAPGPRTVARTTGLKGHERLLQRRSASGKIASGALILAAEDPEAWLWTRVAGEALDRLLLSKGMMADNPEREKAMLATLAVTPVVVLDALYARRSLGRERAEYLPARAPAAVPHPSTPVRYGAEVEQIPKDEAQGIDANLASLHRLHERMHEQYGETVRVSHAKTHGVAVGELTVLDDLPEPLPRGIFRPETRYRAAGQQA